MSTTVNSQPYLWPFDGQLNTQNTALVIIDMQTDFCGKGGYVDAMQAPHRSNSPHAHHSSRLVVVVVCRRMMNRPNRGLDHRRPLHL